MLQASAFLNDRFRVDYSDLYLLAHTLWNKADDIPVIWEMLMEKFFADIDKKLDRMEKSLKQTSQKMLPTDVGNEEAEYKVYNYFYFKVLNYPLGNCFVFMSDNKHLTNQYNEGVIYWDEIHNAYLIQCVDVSQTFSGPGTLQNIKKVKLRRYPGWLEAGGKNYAIERDAAKKKNLLSETTEAVQLDETDKEMEVKIASLQSGAGQQNKSILIRYCRTIQNCLMYIWRKKNYPNTCKAMCWPNTSRKYWMTPEIVISVRPTLSGKTY